MIIRSFDCTKRFAGKMMNSNGAIGSKGLLKWKGVMFAPSDDESDGRCKIQEDRNGLQSATLTNLHEQGYEVNYIIIIHIFLCNFDDCEKS